MGGLQQHPHVRTLNRSHWNLCSIFRGAISRSWKIIYWNIMVYESGRPRYSIITRYNGYNPERQKWLITRYKPI